MRTTLLALAVACGGSPAHIPPEAVRGAWNFSVGRDEGVMWVVKDVPAGSPPTVCGVFRLLGGDGWVTDVRVVDEGQRLAVGLHLGQISIDATYEADGRFYGVANGWTYRGAKFSAVPRGHGGGGLRPVTP